MPPHASPLTLCAPPYLPCSSVLKSPPSEKSSNKPAVPRAYQSEGRHSRPRAPGPRPSAAAAPSTVTLRLTCYALRFTFDVSRITHHASRKEVIPDQAGGLSHVLSVPQCLRGEMNLHAEREPGFTSAWTRASPPGSGCKTEEVSKENGNGLRWNGTRGGLARVAVRPGSRPGQDGPPPRERPAVQTPWYG